MDFLSSPIMVFLLAVIWDLVLGEPPAVVHPVVVMGRMISFLRQRLPPRILSGAIIAATLIFGSALIGHLLVMEATALNALLGTAVAAFLLKSTLAIRSLLQTSRDIGRAIQADLGHAREMLPALVSRDPAGLSSSLATSAVIESLSENFADTIVSPIFFYLILTPFGLGLEGALAFKAISTMDSMLGYRTAELKELGFVPARLDDLANWIPARLSLPLLMMARPAQAKAILDAAILYHARTPSPNSGWPMAAAAGALGIRMEKPGVYVILEGGRNPSSEDVGPAIRLVAIASVLTVVIGAAVLFMLLYLK